MHEHVHVALVLLPFPSHKHQLIQVLSCARSLHNQQRAKLAKGVRAIHGLQSHQS